MQKISIHALREEGDGRCDVVDLQVLEISIHALREEGDLVIQPFGQTLEDFYPRPPRGGRPLSARAAAVEVEISIHALREEGDPSTNFCAWQSFDFYPRPPRGGRPIFS